MGSKKPKKLMIIVPIILLAVIIISVGFSALQRQLLIDDAIFNVRLQEDTRVSASTVTKTGGSAVSNFEDYNVSKIYGSAIFPSTSSYVLYKVDLTNYGNVKTGLLSITSNTSGVNYSICDSNGSNCSSNPKTSVCNGTNCTLGSTKSIYVKVTSTSAGTKNIDLDLDFEPYNKITYSNLLENTSSFESEIMTHDTYQLTFTSKPEEVDITGIVNYTYNKNTGVLNISGVESDINITARYKVTDVTQTSYSGTDPDNYVLLDNELYRFVTKENVNDGYGNTELRAKLIKDASIGNNQFDSSSNEFENSSISNVLNTTYYGTLSNNAKELIDTAIWTENYSDNIGLITSSNYTSNNSWIPKDGYTLTKAEDNKIVAITSTGLVDSLTTESRATYPSVYLKDTVLVVGGSGTRVDPYTLDVAGSGLQPNPTTILGRTLTVNGSSQDLITVTNKIGTPRYSTTTALNSSNYTSGSTTIPSSSSAGNYTIYYYIPEIDGFKAKAGHVTSKINPLSFIVTYQKGSNVSSIGKTNDSCTTSGASLSCSVTLPSITPNAGYENGKWNYNSNQYNPGATFTLNSSRNGITLTATASGKTYTATFNKNGATSISSNSLSCTVTTGSTCVINTSPTIVREGYTIVGWAESASAHLGTTPGGALTLSDDTTFYAITSKQVTITFNKNGNTAQIPNGGTQSNENTVSSSCTMWNTAETCNITSPEIVMEGYTKHGYSTGATTYSNYWAQKTSKAVSANATWFAQTSIAEKTVTITFNKNGNASQTPKNGSASAANTVTESCTIAAARNGASQDTTCSITSPTITPYYSNATVNGYSTTSTDHTSTWNQNTAKDVSSSTTYYAQTKVSGSIRFNANGAVINNNSSLEYTDVSATVYNADDTLQVHTPTITRDGFTVVGWNTSSSSTTKKYNSNADVNYTVQVQNGNAQFSPLYAVTSKEVTLTFNKNGNTSQTKSGGSASTATTITDNCTIWNSATKCSITSPTFVPASGFTAIGYSTSADNHTSEWSTNTSKDFSSNTTYYAQSSKTGVNRTITFYKNGNTAFTYNGNRYTDTSKTFTVCSTPDVYNGASSASSCSANITMPLIEPANGYSQNGWGTAATSTSPSYSSGQSVQLTMDENKSYYALKSLLAVNTPTITGGGTNVYGNARTLTCSTTSTYSSGTDLYYSFGYSTTDGGSPSNWTTASTTATYNAPATYTTRYYSCRVYATNGTLTTETVTSIAGANQAVSYVNARIDFDATTTEGSLNGTSPRYVPYNSSNIYTGRTNTTTGSIPTATKSGYTFAGWYTSASGGSQVINPSGTITSGVSGWTNSSGKFILTNSSSTENTNRLYAHFSARSYTVSFNVNGGSGSGYQTSDVSATYGQNMPTISTTKPSKTGHTFMGWYDSQTYTSGTQYYKADGTSAKTYDKTSNTTLYAGWKANTYTVTFNPNGGAGGQSVEVEATYGSAMPLISTTAPTKTGFTFTGWYDSNNVKYYNANGTSAKNYDKTSDTTLIAGWTMSDPLTPTISGGGTNVYGNARELTCATTSTYATGTSIYYSFGYSTTDGGSPSNWTTASTTATYNAPATYTTRYYSCRVYAKEGTLTSATVTSATSADQAVTYVNARIDFDANGGTRSGTSPLYVPYNATNIYTTRTNTTAGSIPTASKTGYTFKGWYTASTNGTQVINASGTVQASVSGWTDANKKWLLTNSSNTANTNRLYAQFTITNPATPTISGGGTNIYGSTRTLTCSTTTNYASGVDIYYSFGYATSDGGTPSNWTTASTTATYDAPSNYTTRYYSCRVYASDGTQTSGSVTSTTASDQAVTYVNARIDFDATTNGGSLSGSTPRYARYANANLYTTRTGSTTSSKPTATKSGYTFAGWYTSATNGTKVINSDGTLVASVSNWTNASSQFIITNTSDTANTNKLYAQYTISNPATPTISGGGTNVYGNTRQLTCATSTTYATGVTKYYSFGYATTDGGSPSNWATASTTSTYDAPATYTTRYYSCRVYASDGTQTSSTVASATTSDQAVTYVNARINFNASSNGGSLSGTSPVYVQYNNASTYSTRTATTARAIPTATKTGYTFAGWYTSASGGNKIINADGTIVASVSNWTNSSSKFILTSTTDTTSSNVLYAQFTINNPLAPTVGGSGTYVYGSSPSVTCSTSSTYASGTNIYYSFGYTTTEGEIPTNWTSANTSNSLSVGSFTNSRYYSCRVYASDGTNTSDTISNSTSSAAEVTLVNARIDFDATTNGGSLSGTTPMYSRYNSASIYTLRSGANTGTAPTASKAGHSFNGWYTQATGGEKVINADKTIVASVSGWTNENGRFILTNASNTANTNRLYAQFTGNTITASFYYNSNTTSGSITTATATSTCVITSGTSCSVTVPSVVQNSVGKYNSAYSGVTTVINSANTSSTSLSISEDTTYYTVYSSPITIKYPKSDNTIATSTTSLYRNEYFTNSSGTTMSTITSTSNTSTTQATTVTLSSIKGTFKGINDTVNNTSYYAVNNTSSVVNNDATTYYAVTTASENAVIHYNSNTTSGSFTDATANASVTSTYYCQTASAMGTSHGTTTTVPTAVSGSVGKYNSAYKGISSSSTTITNVTTFTGGSTYYAYYSSALTIYYPNTSNGVSNTSTALYRNEYYSSSTAMTTITATSGTSTTQATSVTLSNLKGTLAGITPTVNSTTYYAVNNASNIINKNTTTFYAVTTFNENVVFHYNSNTASGSFTNATESVSVTSRYYCTSTSAQGTWHNTTTVPSVVSGSVGKYNSVYKGISSSSSTITNATTFSGGSTYYAYYSSALTIYYPNTSNGVSSSATALYRNEYYSSSTAMNTITATSQTSTTQATSVTLSNLKGTFAGLNSTVNSTTYYAVNNASNVVNKNTTTFYAITTFSENVTFKYNNNTTCGSATVTSATSAVTSRYYCTSTSAQGTWHNSTTTVPTAVTNSKGQYNSAYRAMAAVNNLTAVTSFSGGSTYYAVYSSAVTNYYYSTEYTNRTLYRNEYLASSSATTYTSVIATANNSKTNYTTSGGPNSSTWYGLADTATATRKYSSVSAAATSNTCTTNLYSIYQYSINYSKGSNVEEIGATTGACRFKYNASSCNVTLPSITPSEGYISVGWNTSSGATTGTAEGQSYSVTTNNPIPTLYANAKEGFYKNTTTNEYYETLNQAFSAVSNNQTIQVYKNATETTTATLASDKTGIKLDLNGKTISMNNVYIQNNGTLDIYNTSSTDGIVESSSTYTIYNTGTFTSNGTSSTKNIILRNSSSETSSRVIYNYGTSSSATLNTNSTLRHITSANGIRYLIDNQGALTIAGANLINDGSYSDRGITLSTATSTLVMTSGTIATTGHAIVNSSSTSTSAVNISGGIIRSSNNFGIQNNVSGVVTITGGTITASNHAISATSGTINLGVKDSTVSTSSPEVISTRSPNYYGIYNRGATFNFYDGIIKSSSGTGKTIYGTVNDIPNGYEVHKETTDGIESAYLTKISMLMQGTSGGETTNFLRTNIKKQDIESITFTNSLSNHTANGTDCFDVSKDEDGGVLAWISDSNSNDKYEMTIGANGNVRAYSGYYLFSQLRNLDSLNGMDYFDTSNVTDMYCMFYYTGYTSPIFTLDLGDNFDTSKVIDMSFMFYNTGRNSTVFTLDLGDKFDTSNVTNMSNMFQYTGYSSTTFTLDLGDNFDTSNVTNMGSMFYGVGYNNASFTLDLGNKFDTSNVTSMSMMFRNMGYGSTSLTLDLGDKFDTSNVTDMSYMFNDTGYSSTVFTLDLGDKFDTSNVTNMNAMFSYTGRNSTSFTLDLGDNFDTSKVTTMSYMFNYTGYSNTTFTLDLGDKFDTTNVTNMSSMFERTGYSNTSFTLDLGSKFDTSNVTNMSSMFSNSRYLKTIYAPSSFVTTSVAYSTNMFSGCTSLVGGAGTAYANSNPKDKTYAHIDGGTSNPGYFTSRSVIVNNSNAINTSNLLTNGRNALVYTIDESLKIPIADDIMLAATKLNTLRNDEVGDISATSKFLGTDILRGEIRSIRFENSLDKHKASDKNTYDVSSLQNGNILLWISNSSKGYYDIVIGSNSEVLAPTNSSYLFGYLYNLESIDFTNFDTSNISNISGMFFGCSKLDSISFDSLFNDNIEYLSMVVYGCDSLDLVSIRQLINNASNVTLRDLGLSSNQAQMIVCLPEYSSLNLTTGYDSVSNKCVKEGV